jgi:hypothetical protein
MLKKIVPPATIILLLPLNGCSFISTWLDESQTVAKEEFSPRAALEKYEWFKEASAQLDKKKSDIAIAQTNLQSIEDAYQGTSRKNWNSDDRTEYNQLQAELSGIKASFNDLAAEYNANMAKFNYQFANKGSLPQGASEPLPREFKPYEVH